MVFTFGGNDLERVDELSDPNGGMGGGVHIIWIHSQILGL